MSKKSTTAIDDDAPITQKDIDAGGLILRKREGGRVVPSKKRVTLYLDGAIVEHFKRAAGERGYQTLINETLRRSLEHADIESTIRKVIREEMKNPNVA